MRLHTHIKGSGFPVLCLHGHPGSGKAMSVFTSSLVPEAAELAQFKTYAPDLRGYGRSHTAKPFEMTRHLDDLEELIAQHQIHKCLLLGWSLGGILAMELALRRPALVQGLILIGTAARPVGAHPPITWQDNALTGITGILNLAFPGHPLVRALGQKSLFRYLIAQHTPLAYEYLAKEGAPAYLRTSRHAASALFGAIRAGYNRLPDIKSIEAPALMLCGECDRHITAQSSLDTAHALPHCEARCYPNTAHLFPWEIPHQMNADIQQWLTAHSDRWQLDPDACPPPFSHFKPNESNARYFSCNPMQIQTPDWVKHAVFYQIFPDRFARSSAPEHQGSNRPPEMQVPLETWESPPTMQGYKGGDLWGVAEQLDYLQDLGITAIYFTPIFQSASNHRYHTHDYYVIDPLLGGNDAFFDLLEAAHARDIKVVLDGVFNHASRGFFYFNDILENGPHSPWLDWFTIHDWPLSAYDGNLPENYKGWVNNRALPEFNHHNPQAREYIMQVGEYWIEQGIDGWRLDVPFEVDAQGFWVEFRDRIKALNPEAYIVGEVWTDSRQWLAGDQFDGVMNYLFTGPTMAFAAKQKVALPLAEPVDYFPYPALDAKGYAEEIESLLNLYDWEIQQTQLNLLSSHDVARALSVMGEDKASMEIATLLLLTFPGAPSIYYGDEVGLSGGLDPDCRRAFPPEQDWDKSLLALHKDLISLRHAHPALRTGKYKVLAAEGECYVFARMLESEMIVVAVNSGDRAIQVRLADMPVESGTLLYGEGKVDWVGDRTAMLQIPARAGIILGG